MKVLLIHPGHSYSTGDVFDGMKAGLEANGVEVIVYDTWRNMRLMNKWAGFAAQGGLEDADPLYKLGNWLASADALGLALDHQVDAAVVVTGLLFPPERARQLQQIGIPVACYGTEAPYFTSQERHLAQFYTHWFTNERRSVPYYQDVTRCTYLPHAWNPEKHLPGPVDSDKQCDVAFVGGGFPERQDLLNGVDWTGIDLQKRGTLWHGETDLSAGAIPNTETLAWHRSATIALNIHRRMTRIDMPDVVVADGEAESLGPRAYEIPACGGFMLCDSERPELFDVLGDAACAFRAWDSSSLEREVRYWLKHPERREAAAKAQHEAIRPHSWTRRAAQLLTDLIA